MITSNNAIPDVYCWHLIRQPGGSGGDDINYSKGVFEQMLQQFGLPSLPINIDEYGVRCFTPMDVILQPADKISLLKSRFQLVRLGSWLALSAIIFTASGPFGQGVHLYTIL